MVTGERYTVEFDALDQQVNFEGVMRTGNDTDLKAVSGFLKETHDRVSGLMRLNFRKLRYISAPGVGVVTEFLKYAREARKLSIKLIGSKVITWEEKTLSTLTRLWDGIEFVIHDEGFYSSQGIIEDADFIPLLRNQTRLLWPLEKPVLERHGLRDGMQVADICCGCGDVALLVAREMRPGNVTAIDHSVPGIEYAIRTQTEFAVNNVDFRLGDATALMVEDESFDFVMCRLSLQIFSKPEQIMKELVRITRRGGRIYLLGEDYDLIVGHPNDQDIRTVYGRAGDYGTQMGMDLYNGKKLYTILNDHKLRRIRVDQLCVDTANSDRRAFGEMISSWRHFSAETIGAELKLPPADKASLLAGYDAHLRTINHPFGYTTWTVVAASGEKR